jgi:hypothetical protein
MAYAWNRETITVSEIMAILFEQYDQNPTISVPISDGHKTFHYKKDMIPVHCNRCGNKYQITPQLLLSIRDDRGYACSKCGNLSDAELQEKIHVDMMKNGRDTLLEMGINPDEDDEEEREKKEAEEEDQELARAMLEEGRELFGPVPPEAEEETPPVPPQEMPPPPQKAEVNPGNLNPAVDSKKESVESSSPSPQADTTVIETEENADGEDIQFGEFEEENPFNKYLDDLGDEEETEDEMGDDDDDMIADGFLNDIQETDEEADPQDSDESLETTEDEEIGEDTVELNGKHYSIESLFERFNEIQKELSKKLGYVPYTKAEYDDGILEVGCSVCGKTFDIGDIETLINDSFTFTKENAVAYGQVFKGDLNISACPHCKSSIFSNGFNSFYRKKVEDTVKKSGLTIVKPESYWYASPFETFSFEANGIVQKISYIDLCNKYRDIDMSKHELFKPRGTATKSEATSVDNDKRDSSEGVFTIPKHAPKTQFDFTAYENSPEIMFERQQKQAESQQVFHKDDKAKKTKETIAILNGKENPFEREERLDVSFTKTIFYDFIKELANECGVKFRFEINQRTFQIPVVDFEPYSKDVPGFRLICAQYDRDTMFNVPFSRIARSIPFLFNNKVGQEAKYQYSVLYGDSIQYRPKATFNALVKYINPTKLAYGGKRIQLEGNLSIQYTDYPGYLNEFSLDCSPFPDGKPNNGELGILSQWVSSKEYDARDILETLNSLEDRRNSSLDKIESDMGLYLVCSIKYIKQLNKNTQKMCYTITEYVELGGALIADGLYQCIRALLKEYYMEYPTLRDRVPHIIIEIDPNSYTSPSIRHYIRNKALLPVDKLYRATLEGKDSNNLFNFYTSNYVGKHLKYVYMKRNANRDEKSSRDFMRRDIRKFNAASLKSSMAEEIKAAGLQMGINDDTQRLIFIRNMGFTEATQLEIKEYFMNQGIVQQILLEGQTILLPKAVNPDSMFNQGGIVNSSGNNLWSINDPMHNPLFRAKMERIRSGYMTPEANEFYMSYMRQKQQEEMNNTAYQMPPQGFRQGPVPVNPMQQGYPGVWQGPMQPPPVMTQGAFYMPNIPGMGN